MTNREQAYFGTYDSCLYTSDDNRNLLTQGGFEVNIDSIDINLDFTDFDKILEILFNKGFKTIDVFGASGKEQDHFLGNLDTAVKWKEKLNLTFFDNYSHYFLADTYTKILNCKEKKYVKCIGVDNMFG